MIRYGITGTDTGVGKTVVACALVHALRERGLTVAAMKPVETGFEDEPPDARLLWDAAGRVDALDDVCPERFHDPLAPYLAARRAGRAISIPGLDAARSRLESGRDALVVEGAGGLLVTIAEGMAFDTLFRRWELDCVVVAANRLGAINHTMLTVRAALAAGLRVPAVVLNTICPTPPTLAELTNLDTLQELLPGTVVLPFPYNGGAVDLRRLV